MFVLNTIFRVTADSPIVDAAMLDSVFSSSSRTCLDIPHEYCGLFAERVRMCLKQNPGSAEEDALMGQMSASFTD